ncbi:cytosolic protein [Chryseobacterium sp. G0201]|nr:cytosolic protein [Chryseobacterium sp. G0201]
MTEINGQPADLTALHEKITNVDQNGHKGIDGVYENASPPPKYVIVEAKYGSSDLSQTPKDGPQMSKDWILGSERLENAVGPEIADDIRFEIENNPSNVQRVLSHVDANGNVTTSTIDANGNVTGPWP